MTGGLASAQAHMLQAIWQPAPDPTHGFHTRGLAAYRSNANELAQRALAAAYPVVLQLLGSENFGALARLCWQRHPPVRGDLAQWGGALAGLIEQLPDLCGQEPYLSGVARCEWALHVAASAADAQMDADSFQLLTNSDPAQLTLVLAPGTTLVASEWPVASIVTAHLLAQPDLHAVAARLRDNVAETALVWRDGQAPRLRAATAGEERFIAALQRGHSLAGALQPARGLDLAAWLAQAFQSRLMVGVRAL